MLYLFAGDDAKNKIISYEKLLASFEKKSEIFSINKNNFSFQETEIFFSTSGLFFEKYIIIFWNLLEKEEFSTFLLNRLEKMFSSKNTFIFI